MNRNTRVVIAGLIVFFAGAGSQSFAQRAYEEFRPPWYAEAVRLGDAYTAIARGLAAVQHNPAGLAEQKGYAGMYSSNTGMLVFSDYDKIVGSGAVSGHIDAWNISAALSYSRLDFEYRNVWKDYQVIDPTRVRWNSRLYAGHVAAHIGGPFSAALSIYHYTLNAREYSNFRVGWVDSPHWESQTDIGLSVLARFPALVSSDSSDELSAGAQAVNLLGSDVEIAGSTRTESLYRQFRGGIAYATDLPAGRIGKRSLLRVMVAVDASLNRWYDDYSLLRYAGAVETTVAEILMLSAGFEDHTWLDNSWDPEAIFRWGVGLRYPVGELLRMRQHIDLQIDYARSDFPLGHEYIPGADGYVDPVVWSVSLRWVP